MGSSDDRYIWPRHLLAVSPQVSYLTLLNLCFLTCKMGVQISLA